MKLLTKSQESQLLKNGSPEHREKDHAPVVKLFTPWTGCTWLLTELDPEEPRRAFGLCDLGMGYPELGYVDLDEIESVKGPFGLTIERDIHFEGTFPISVYAEAARYKGQITERHDVLSQFVPKNDNPPGFQPQ
jgi:hypothetical protein